MRAPYKGEIRRFHGSLASIGEISVFVALGLTVSLHQLFSDNRWLEGIALAVVISFVVRPLVVGALLVRTRLRRGEKLFVAWSGLKGAVPILLAAFALLEHVERRAADLRHRLRRRPLLGARPGDRHLARRRARPACRCARSSRSRGASRSGCASEPHDLRRFVVAAGSRAAGHALSEIPFSDSGWVSLIVRDGEPVPARGSTVLEPGDLVIVLADPPDHEKLQRLFEG